MSIANQTYWELAITLTCSQITALAQEGDEMRIAFSPCYIRQRIIQQCYTELNQHCMQFVNWYSSRSPRTHTICKNCESLCGLNLVKTYFQAALNRIVTYNKFSNESSGCIQLLNFEMIRDPRVWISVFRDDSYPPFFYVGKFLEQPTKTYHSSLRLGSPETILVSNESYQSGECH